MITATWLAAADDVPRVHDPLPSDAPQGRIESIAVLGLRVAAVGRSEAISRLATLVEGDSSARVVFVNAACANIAARDQDYFSVVQDSDLILNDGIGLDIAARLQGKRFPDNMNGTDFTPELLKMAAASGKRVFLLGGLPGVAEQAKSRLEAAIPGLSIVGIHHGYLPDELSSQRVAAAIRRSQADILIVGMGAPRQERWLDRYLASTGARLGVAVGAFIDFAAGKVARAPQCVRRARLEWVFRLTLEPKRLCKRYIVGTPVFLARICTERARCVVAGADQPRRITRSAATTKLINRPNVRIQPSIPRQRSTQRPPGSVATLISSALSL